jgi:uncharacterized integral membrane protein
MVSTTRNATAHSPRVIPGRGTRPVSNGSPITTEPLAAQREVGPAQDAAASNRETRRDRSRRKAHRTRLHAYAIASVALVASLIALAASNTAHVKINWVFGTSHVSIVWLVLFAAVFGWLLGLAMTAAFHWRTRAPRRQDAPQS